MPAQLQKMSVARVKMGTSAQLRSKRIGGTNIIRARMSGVAVAKCTAAARKKSAAKAVSASMTVKIAAPW